MAENNIHSVKLKSYYLVILILLPIIIAALLMYLTFRQDEVNHLYMLLMILFGSFLGSIKFYNIPREIKVTENVVRLKSIYGKEIILEIKDISAIEKKYGLLFIKIKKDRIIGISKFPKILELLDTLKKNNPDLVLKGITK